MMHLAHAPAWWLAVLIVAGVGALAWYEYRRPLAPLSPAQRGVLIACRLLALAAIVVGLMRPIVLLPPDNAAGAVVPVLVDVSRSMRLGDADGQSRQARASTLLRTQLLPPLSRLFKPDVYAVGERLTPAGLDRLGADARRTDLAGALTAIREQTRGQRVAGIVLISDGADTGQHAADDAAAGAPVFAIGVGSPDGVADREVLGIAAGDPRLDQSSVDLHVSAVSTGLGRTPFPLRILADGRAIETRRVVPPADGSPIEETFTVSPDPTNPTVYTADIPVDPGEGVAENNTRSVLVNPAGRKRRVLVVEGAPGFEHSFLKRALARDSSLEVDSIVRKGKNADGQDTFFVQAGSGRAQALLAGFPARREDLYAYDALVIANVEGDYFTRAQLALAADFVSERGGGLLVMGGQSFTARGLTGTPLEEALPVELNDRRSGVVRTSGNAPGSRDAGAPNKIEVTSEGENHPIMRIAGARDESLKAWAALPALSSSVALGGARPGATVLAITHAPGGAVLPIVAVQPYGKGRSMIFAGEASWRWKMLVSSADRAHEFFWRQAVRWLARPAPDRVSIDVPESAEPGDTIAVSVDVRDAAFAPVRDADVTLTLTAPDEEAAGQTRTLRLRRADASSGRLVADVPLERPGLHRLRAEAQRGASALGAADRWFYVGGADREFADPRLNEAVLRRIARASGGRYVRASDAGRVVSWLQDTAPRRAAPEPRDVWHTWWTFALVAALLCAEWMMRRSWGLR